MYDPNVVRLPHNGPFFPYAFLLLFSLFASCKLTAAAEPTIIYERYVSAKIDSPCPPPPPNQGNHDVVMFPLDLFPSAYAPCSSRPVLSLVSHALSAYYPRSSYTVSMIICYPRFSCFYQINVNKCAVHSVPECPFIFSYGFFVLDFEFWANCDSRRFLCLKMCSRFPWDPYDEVFHEGRVMR